MATALVHISECPVCLEAYKDPKVLPCDHSLCANCVDGVRRGSRIKCPICNATHAVTKVRADFRLAQFIDALKESQPQKEPSEKTDGSNKCEICYRHPVSFRCEECAQWMCNDCNTIHLRITGTKDHKVVPITIKCQQIKNKFSAKSSDIKSNIKQQEESIDAIDAEILRLQTEQTNVLQASDTLRQKSLTEVKDYFDTMDARIIAFIHKHVAELEVQKQQLAKKQREVSAKYERLEQTVNVSSAQLAMEGSSILTDIEVLSTACTSAKVDITQAEIKVLQGRAWDASTAAVLDVKEGRMDCRVAESRDHTHTPLNLTTLGERKFTQRKQVDVKQWPHALRMFDDELWLCQNGGSLEIFSHELQKLRTLTNEAWGDVHDVTQMPDGELIIACSRGLYHITRNGETLSEFDSRKFNNVMFYGNKLYAYAWQPGSVLIYQHNTTWNKLNTLNSVLIYQHNTTWNKLNTLKLPFSRYTWGTLSVTHNAITACSDNDHNIIVTSLTGKVRQTFGEHGSGSAGKLNYPMLCQSDQDRSLLIADLRNDRLQVVDKHGQWKVVHMTPDVNAPRGVVYTHNKLYVASSGGGNKLSLYTSD